MSIHQHQMFPFEFMEYLVKHFNFVIRDEMLRLSRNRLTIVFDRTERDDKNTVISLFTKIVTAFKSINDRYLGELDQHTQLKINIEEKPEEYQIQLSGIVYIPPGKFLNLFSLFLWYYVRYKTGHRPNDTEYGSKLNEKWKKEEKSLRFEINQSRRQLTMEHDLVPCYICGEPTYRVNQWEFRPHRNFKGIDMKTRVCQKHSSELI